MNKTKIHWDWHSTTKRVARADEEEWAQFRSILVGHKIYAHGGYGTHTQYRPPQLFEYNVHTRSWKTHRIGGEMPAGINGNSVALVGDKMISFGLGGNWAQLTQVHYIDLVHMCWHVRDISCDQMFSPRSYHVADYWEDRGVLLVNACSIANNNELYNTTVSVNVDTWTLQHVKSKGSPPTRRAFHSSLLHAQRKQWFIVGGQSRQRGPGGPPLDSLLSDVYILSLSPSHRPTWSCAAPAALGQRWMPPVHSASLIANGSRLIVLGGLCNSRPERHTSAFDVDMQQFVTAAVSHTGDVPSANDFRVHQIVRIGNKGFYLLPCYYRHVWQMVWSAQVK